MGKKWEQHKSSTLGHLFWEVAFGWLWRLHFCPSLLYSWKMVISSFYGPTLSCLFLIKLSAILGNANRRKQQIRIYMTGCLARYQQRKATTGINPAAFSCMTYAVGSDERAFLSPGFSILENFSLFSLCLLIFTYRRAQRLLFLLPFIPLPSSSPFIFKDSHI